MTGRCRCPVIVTVQYYGRTGFDGLCETPFVAWSGSCGAPVWVVAESEGASVGLLDAEPGFTIVAQYVLMSADPLAATTRDL